MKRLLPNTYFSGVMALLPIFSLLIFPVLGFSLKTQVFDHHSFSNFFYCYSGFHLLITLYFIIYSLRAPTVPDRKRALWVVLIFLLGFLVFPFFRYRYIYLPDRATWRLFSIPALKVH